nr:hypothetical protein [Deinococcus apachensis]
MLHEGPAPELPNSPQTGGAVVEHAGEQHADHLYAVRLRCRAEEDVDGGTGEILLRAARQMEVVVHDQQVMIGGSDGNRPGLEAVAMPGVAGGEGSGVGEQLGQVAGLVSEGVDDEQEGGGEVGREDGDELEQGGEGASGATDHDQGRRHGSW